MENYKIIFLGTSEFGAIILEGLIENNYKPVLVITAPDKPAGRKQLLTPPPVKITAQKYNIPVEQPEEIFNFQFSPKENFQFPTGQAIFNKFSNFNFQKIDLIICAAYGQILPKEILKIPKYGCLNIHPSLLPKYRGPSPIQTAILNGDKKTGVTIILMDEKMDHGPILAKQEWEIPNPKHQIPNKSQIPMTKITYQELHNKLAELGIKLLLETIPKWIKGEIKPKPQDELKATYTKILKREDGEIDWSKPANEIERKIRAFNPWPGAFFFWKKNNKKLRIKILEAELSKDNQLIIKKLQPEGKRPMSFEDFKKGYPCLTILN